MATPRYAELRCRSCFSFLEGASHPEELVARAAELGLSALALSDRNGLQGIVRAWVEAKRLDFPLIVGSELAVADLGRGRPGWLTLLAIDREGYANLCRLITTAHGGDPEAAAAGRRDPEAVRVAQRLLGERAGGLFALYGGHDGEAAAQLRDLFGRRLALTVARHHVAGDEARVAASRAIGERLGIPVAVVNDVETHVRRRQVLQDVLTCVRLGTTVEKAGRRLAPNAERTLKGPEEMARLWADFPEGLETAAEIAARCRFRMDEIRGEHPLPPVRVDPATLAAGAALSTSSPAQAERAVAPQLVTRLRTTRGAGRTGLAQGAGTPEPAEPVGGMALLRSLVGEGARWRYGGEPPPDVARQLEKELTLVEQLGYASYFLTVWDVVRFARQRGILCQGRGSAANSAVCYVLGVTSIDPVRMGLLFERFISAERGEPPDIDIDFEHERREEVLQYVYERYGRAHAGMVCEVITYRTRSALRDVGKALGLSLSQVDRLTKAVSHHEDPAAVTDATLVQAGLDPGQAPRVRQVLALAGELQGFPRHLSIHVGGFVITRRPLSETVPIEPAAMPGRTIVQWDKDDLAALDLLKVDLLALGMLTALSRALDQLARHQPAPAHPTPVPLPDSLATIPAEDPAVYAMASRADTIGVFQIESRAQMGLLPRLQPRCFYDLVISVAIIRPGPIQGGMVHPFLRRRDGREAVVYPYPPLEPVLARTLGIPLFQEQAMRLAVVAAGFTPGEADELRRVMTHRRSHERLAAMKARLVAGMAERRIPAADAEKIFTHLLGFAGYGFPESHAASFALLVYASAWLKCYHPAVFAAALINSQPMGFYAPHTLVEDAKRHGVEVRGVDVGWSGWETSLEGPAPGSPPAPGEPPAIRLGLHLVQGLPRDVGEAVVAARRDGPFGAVAALCLRAGLSRAWATRLAEAGALSGLEPERREAVWKSMALPAQPDTGDLFAGLAPAEPAARLEPAGSAELLQGDYATTGLSVRGHPMALVRPSLAGGRVRTVRELSGLDDRAPVEVAGLVIVRQRPETAHGIVFVSLEDETGIANLVVMPDVYERCRPVVRGSPFLLARGRVERNGRVVNVRVDALAPLAFAPSVGERARNFH
jgi:error-prone DNA polymerase